MAQNTQTFILVGEFKDNITPSLKKLNTSITGLNKNFAKLQKMVRPVAKDMAIMAEAATRMSVAFKAQKSGLDSGTRSLQQYRKELGKAAAAQRQLQKKMRTPTLPGGGGGGGTRGWRGNRPKAGGGRGGYGGGGNVVGDVVAGGLITASIVKGFEIGTQMIERTFRYVGQAFAERVEDQIADIASAGGIFAGAKNAGLTAFGSTMDDAMDVQKDLNRQMASLAADLPGTTNDFVRNARSITDTMMTAMSKQPKEFVSAMEKMTGKKGLGEKGAFAAATTSIAQSTTMLEKLAPGGGMPMTMLFEDMMSRETIDAKQMQRKYASMRRNPTLIAALERNQKEINKYAAGSADRLVAISKALNEAVPPEMINMMKRSVSGVMEAFKSNFLDPDTGMFGLSRQMGFMVRQFDTTTGKARKKAGKDLEEAVGIFEMISDIIGNFGVLLNSSIVPAMQALFFPFDDLGKSLVRLREYSFKLFEQFQSVTAYFGKMAESFGMDAGSFKASTRGGLTVIANVFRSLGEINEGKYQELVSRLKSKDVKEVDKVGAEILNIFKGSKFLDMLTETIGTIVGGILDAVANVMDMMIEGTEKFAAKGFGKGFMKAGGYKALTRIFANAFKILAKLIFEGIKLWFASMFENLKRLDFGALLGQAGITAAFLWPFLGGPIKMLMANLFTAIGVRIAALNLGGLIAGWLPVFVQAFQTLGAFIIAPIVGALKTALANAARIALSGAGLAAIAAVAVAGLVYVFRDPIKNAIAQLKGWIEANFTGALRELLINVTQVWTGTVNVIAGLFGMLLGIVTMKGEMIKASWNQFVQGVIQWVQGLIGVLKNAGGALTQVGGMIAGAVKDLFFAIVNKIKDAAKWIAGMGNPSPKPTPSSRGRGGRAFDGRGGRTMPLNQALASEMRNKPRGSHLVIANSSETIIPAGTAAGGQGSGIAAIVGAIQSSAQNTANVMIRGFGELSKATIAGDTKIAQAQASSTAQLMTAIKAASAFSGFGGMGGGMKLGGGMGGAGVKVAGMLGNFIKATGGAPGSIHEHPMHGGVKGKHSPGSYHYSGRAIDIGAFANEQGGVISRIQQFNSKYGVRPVEFLHAGNDRNHQDHVHVAYAKGFNNPTLFTSAKAAVAYEGMMAPPGSRVLHARSVTSNSSEIGGRAPVTVNQNITISGAQDPKALAALVFDYAAQAAQRVNNNSFA